VATTFYFPSTGAAAVTPSNDTWDKTSGAGSALAAVRTKISSAMATITNTKTSAANSKSLVRQYVTEPLAAQTITGTIKGQFRCIESNSNFSACIAVSVRACSKDGTTIRSPALLAISWSDLYTNSSHEMATSLTNRKLEDVNENASLTLTSCTLSEGDRLVIELGFAASDTSTSRTGGISFGDNHSTNLGENITDTAAYNPWIQFSQTLGIQLSSQLNDAMSIGEAKAQNEQAVKTDALSISEALAKAFAKLLSEGMSIGEALDATRQLIVSQSDAVALSEAIARAESACKVDAVVLGEALLNGVSKVLADAMSIGDLRTVAATKIILDALSQTDAITLAVSKVLADAMSLSEAINTWVQSSGLSKSVSDPVSLGDQLANTLAKVQADAVTLGEAIAKAEAHAISDAVTLADSRAFAIVRILADSLGMSDQQAFAILKCATDPMALDESRSLTVLILVTLADAMLCSDGRVLGAVKLLQDNVAMVEAMSRTAAYLRGFGDSLAMGDSTDCQSAFVRALTDAIQLGDSQLLHVLVVFTVVTLLSGKSPVLGSLLQHGSATTRPRTPEYSNRPVLE
jgi:hypothetical protein